MLQNAPLGAFCNTFDLHKVIIGLENQFWFFLRVAVLHRFYYSLPWVVIEGEVCHFYVGQSNSFILSWVIEGILFADG